MRVESCLAQRALDVLEQVCLLELASGEIHAHHQRSLVM